VTAAGQSATPLPLWRLIGGFGILGTFLIVIGLLAPFYFHNVELTGYVRSLPPASDETLRSEVVERAHALGLPVQPVDIQITHDGGRIELHTKYVVKNLSFYPVDLHLQANTR
jgi:hypothetical protein